MYVTVFTKSHYRSTAQHCEQSMTSQENIRLRLTDATTGSVDGRLVASLSNKQLICADFPNDHAVDHWSLSPLTVSLSTPTLSTEATVNSFYVID